MVSKTNVCQQVRLAPTTVALSGSAAPGLATQPTLSVAIACSTASSAYLTLSAASASAIRIPACAPVVCPKVVLVARSNMLQTTAAAIQDL